MFNVWFGHLRVWAREAKFDRLAANDKKPLIVSKSGHRKVEGDGGKDVVGGGGLSGREKRK